MRQRHRFFSAEFNVATVLVYRQVLSSFVHKMVNRRGDNYTPATLKSIEKRIVDSFSDDATLAGPTRPNTVSST